MLNYSDLYELLRKEKYTEALQPLPKNFLQEVADYFQERKNQSQKDDDLFSDMVGKTKKQYENSLTNFKELIRIRKKKLLNLVFVATETGMMKRDYENMIIIEKTLFDKLIKTLEEGDKEIAKNLVREKEQKTIKNKMVLFNQDVEQFMDLNGSPIGPFLTGQLANLELEISEILVSGGKARFVDEE